MNCLLHYFKGSKQLHIRKCGLHPFSLSPMLFPVDTIALCCWWISRRRWPSRASPSTLVYSAQKPITDPTLLDGSASQSKFSPSVSSWRMQTSICTNEKIFLSFKPLSYLIIISVYAGFHSGMPKKRSKDSPRRMWGSFFHITRCEWEKQNEWKCAQLPALRLLSWPVCRNLSNP